MESGNVVGTLFPDSMLCQSYSYRLVRTEHFLRSNDSLAIQQVAEWKNNLYSEQNWSVGEWSLSLAILLSLSLITLLLMVILSYVIHSRMSNSKLKIIRNFFPDVFMSQKTWNKFKLSDLVEHVFCLQKVENLIPINTFFDLSPINSHIACCYHRRLSEILGDPTIQIGQVLRHFLIQDLIYALIHLQVLGLCHGNLKTSNCLITPRWQLILTHSDLPAMSKKDCLINLLWKAPELLRDPRATPTIRSDVYSFGLVVHELIHRFGPFGIWKDYGSDPSIAELQAILYQVKQDPARHERKPLRPLNQQGPKYLEDCWNENPRKRPNFLVVNYRHNPTMNSIGSSESTCDAEMPTVVDLMMDEVYNPISAAIDLDPESRILAKEIADKEDQLYQVLPEYATESLALDLRVEPKEFPFVSILFGRITNFEELSMNRSPEEIYNLVREVSYEFVSITKKYRVYKLETLNDDYLVASWPELVADREGNPTRETALLALELKSHFKNFQIPFNSPATSLNLHFSIGIHVGAAAGAVIGLSRPHYHMFGTTVNVASRLSTSGETGRIQVSQQCNEILKLSREFETVRRGTIFMKGVGNMVTYWLINQHMLESAIVSK